MSESIERQPFLWYSVLDHKTEYPRRLLGPEWQSHPQFQQLQKHSPISNPFLVPNEPHWHSKANTRPNVRLQKWQELILVHWAEPKLSYHLFRVPFCAIEDLIRQQ